MSNDVTLSTYSYGFTVTYFVLSFLILLGLFFLRKIVKKKHSYPLYIMAILINVCFSTIQGLIFRHGDSFINHFYSINFIEYDVVWKSSLAFMLAYLVLIPGNNYYKKRH
ncbi:conserved membrane protein of unknown function [Serratia sp. Tan611]|nr:conserved membrane protein of unknown function [Serratia sp. Tan611]